MSENHPLSRRRLLPVLGVTTVGLAVGAGSLGLYTGATAEPIKSPLVQAQGEQPIWNAALKPADPQPDPAPAPPPVSQIVHTSAEVAVPEVPMLPILPPIGMDPKPSTPVIPNLPNQWPPLPKAPDVVKPAAIEPLAVPGTLTIPAPLTPDVPKPAELIAPLVTLPAVPKPIEVAPIPRLQPIAPEPIAPAIPSTSTTAATPAPLAITEVAPPMQPAKSVDLVQPVVPAPVNFSLPPVQPELNLKLDTPTPMAPIVPSVGPEAASLVSLPKLAPTTPSTIAPGDTPMIPTIPFLRSALVGAALAAAPVSAQTPAEKLPVEKKDALKADDLSTMKKQLEDITKELGLNKTFRDNTEDVIQGRKNAETGKTDPGLISKVLDFDARLRRIEETLLRLEKSMSEAAKSTSAYSPKDTSPMAMIGPRSTVRIVNEYPVQISMIVNGKSHRLEPNETKLVEITAGSYTYELLHAGAQATNGVIKDGDTITLRIK